MVSGLSLYPAGRQPEGNAAHGIQPIARMGGDRLLAWRRTAFYPVGDDFGITGRDRKAVDRKMAEKEQNFIPCICTVRDSTDLDGVCNSDPAGNRRLFRTAVPVLWRGQRGQSRGFRKRTDTVYSGACRRHFALHPAGLPVV